jgi:hypothetical protein
LAELADITKVRYFRVKPGKLIEVQRHWGQGPLRLQTDHGEVFVQPGQFIVSRKVDGVIVEQYPISEATLLEKYEEVIPDDLENA